MEEVRHRRRRESKQPDSLLPVKFFIVLAALLAVIILIAEGCQAEDPAEPPATEPSQSEPQETTEPRNDELLRLTKAEMAQGDLVLVNAEYGFDSESVSVTPLYQYAKDCYYVADWQLSVQEHITTPLNDWLTALYNATGINDTLVVAGHRTVEYQQGLYDQAVANKGQAHADAYIALPGHSEHHTGLAIDFDSYTDQGVLGGFDGEEDYQKKLVDSAGDYGFIQRYPPNKSDITGIDYEAWHFRYVGLPHSYVMSTENLCLEEYIDYLKDFPYDGEHLQVECQGKKYEVYYCQGLEVYVPKDRGYTLSGNNVDGFIVTIEE